MGGISKDFWGYAATLLIVLGLLAFGVAALWAMAHPGHRTGYRSEWHCLPRTDYCERQAPLPEVRAAPKPKKAS